MSPCPFCRHWHGDDCGKHVKLEARGEGCPYFELPEDKKPDPGDAAGQGMMFGEVSNQ